MVGNIEFSDTLEHLVACCNLCMVNDLYYGKHTERLLPVEAKTQHDHFQGLTFVSLSRSAGSLALRQSHARSLYHAWRPIRSSLLQ